MSAEGRTETRGEALDLWRVWRERRENLLQLRVARNPSGCDLGSLLAYGEESCREGFDSFVDALVKAGRS